MTQMQSYPNLESRRFADFARDSERFLSLVFLSGTASVVYAPGCGTSPNLSLLS